MLASMQHPLYIVYYILGTLFRYVSDLVSKIVWRSGAHFEIWTNKIQYMNYAHRQGKDFLSRSLSLFTIRLVQIAYTHVMLIGRE